MTTVCSHLKLGNFPLFSFILWNCVVKHKKRLSEIVDAFLGVFLALFSLINHRLNTLDLLCISFVVEVDFLAMVFTATQYFLNVLLPLSFVLFLFESLLLSVQLILLDDAVPLVALYFLTLLRNLCEICLL
jgi:hypothetical protein